MSFIIAGAAIAGAGAIYNTVDGISKENDAKRLAKNNKRPWYNIPSEYAQNDNIAASQAETGLSPSTVNYFSTQSNRGLGTGVDAVLQGGGDVNSLSKLYDQFSQSLNQESAQDEALRTGHINTFINANKDLAGQKTQQWALNYYEPYKDTAQLASAEKNAGQQQIGTGIGEAVGAASTLSNQELYKSGATGAAGVAGATMGGVTGREAITDAQPKQFGNISTTFNAPDIFGTPGGSAVINNTAKTDANSTQLQQLIDLLNQPKRI